MAEMLSRGCLAVLPLLLAITSCGGAATRATATTATAATASQVPSPTLPPVDTASPTDVRIPVAGTPPTRGVPWYLAIGDSITAGFTIDPARARVNSSWALQLQGLLAAHSRPWRLYDVACPGETTLTYRGACPQRRFVPLLATTSQHDAALAAVASATADLKLILIDLGSNDLLHARADGAPPAQVALALRTNLRSIVGELESAAPGVPVVIANYYDPLANSDPSTVGPVALINRLVAQVAADTHARLADFAKVINTAGPPDPDLGRYVDLAHGDIHPTVAGHARLAAAALAAVLAAP